MPSLRGVTVHVTDHKGKEFAEWGVQRLRQRTEKREKVSAYIQSSTGVQFHVSLQPEIPFVDVDHPESESEIAGVDQMKAEEADCDLLDSRSLPRHPGGSSPYSRAGPEDPSTDHDQRTNHGKANLALSSPLRGQKDYDKVPEYGFIASLFLDGRETPERKVIVYLDPADKDFARPDGKVFFKHRWVQSKDGTMTENAWVFKEKAIESVFDRLMIATSQARNEGHDEDAIIEAMQFSGLGGEDDYGAEQSKVGQIVVELKRVILGDKKYDRHYRSKHQEGQDDDIDMAGMKPDVTHATGFAYRSTIAPSPLRVVDYWDYKPEEGCWATFQFFYRSAEQLHKFGFPGFQNKSKPSKRALNDRMPHLTPLSIAQLLVRDRRKVKEGTASFEETINKKNFEPEDDKAKLEFGSEYRDVSADDEMEAEEFHKYPAARLPFLVSKVPKADAQREVTIPGLPTLHQSTVSDVASTLRAAKTLVELKQPTSTPRGESSNAVPPFFAIGSPSYHRPDDEARRRLSSYLAIGDASTRPSTGQLCLATPASLTTQQGSVPPLPNSLTKENVAKLSVVSGRGLRLSPPIHAGNSDVDDEDADDELRTESDLETHADDEAFDYSANPEEYDEDHHILRTQLKNVALRKRTHAEVEDVEEEKEGSEENGIADKEAGDNGASSQVQETSVQPMTEREKVDGHNCKKARTVSSRGPGGLLAQPLSSPGGIADRKTGEGKGV